MTAWLGFGREVFLEAAMDPHPTIALPDHSKRGHSPLGASGAERWMNCAGSVALITALKQQIEELGIEGEDDPDYRKEGTALHEGSEVCLTDGLDAWEIEGREFATVPLDVPMTLAIQEYVDACRRDMKRAIWFRVEYQISSPVHPDFYGTADFAAILASAEKPWEQLGLDPDDEILTRDLKGGEGIIVEPDENPQMIYYTFGVVDQIERTHGVTLRDDLKVRLSIVQPRAFHVLGPIREWTTTVGWVKRFVRDQIVPAMETTAFANELAAGDWCRFCPAKLVCPLLTSLARAAATYDPKEIVNFDDYTLGQAYTLRAAVKFYLKAVEEEILRRALKGRTFEGHAKLVDKKANRVWKPGAEARARKEFGDQAFTEPEIKSPAELEKLGAVAKEFVKGNAFMPKTGHTIALWSDPKPAVRVTTAVESFGAAVQALSVGQG